MCLGIAVMVKCNIVQLQYVRFQVKAFESQGIVCTFDVRPGMEKMRLIDFEGVVSAAPSDPHHYDLLYYTYTMLT